MTHSNVPLDLSSRLNARRRALGIKVTDLSKRMGLSVSNVEALMTGKRSPTPAIAESLIQVLDLDPEFAGELRALKESRYKSGFATGEIRLTREPDAE